MKNKMILIFCMVIILLSTFSYAQNLSITGVSYYNFNNTLDDIWNNIRAVGSGIYNTTSFPIFNNTYNKSSPSMTFNYSRMYFNGDDLFNFEDVFCKGNYTLSVWIYKFENKNNIYDTIFTNTKGSEPMSIFSIQNNTNTVRLYLENETGYIILQSSTILNYNKWYHLALVYNNKTENATLYINGKKDIEKCSRNWYNITALTYGGWGIGAQTRTFSPQIMNTFHGNIDEFKIFNIALTEEQVKNEYNTGSRLSIPKIILNKPLNNSINQNLNLSLNVSIIELDGDDINISFFWENKSVIYSQSDTINRSFQKNVILNEYNITYEWFVNVTDGMNYVKSDLWNFTTKTLIISDEELKDIGVFTPQLSLNDSIGLAFIFISIFFMIFIVLIGVGLFTKNKGMSLFGLGVGIAMGIIILTVSIALGTIVILLNVGLLIGAIVKKED